MKTLFIEAKSKSKVNINKILEVSKKLPKNIALAYSIQFIDIAQNIKEILSNEHNITLFSQVLGCSHIKPPRETEAVLLIGSGRFHGISLALETKLPIYILDKITLIGITKQEIEKLQNHQKTAYLKFLNANKAGVLISAKPGQNRLKQALEFKKELNKKTYLFLANNINSAEFENFGLDSWVNTACPRLDLNNSNIINMSVLKEKR